MVGRELTNRFPPKDQRPPASVAARGRGPDRHVFSRCRDVSFSLRKGEIVGLAGLDGSGRTEVLENIFGVATRKTGSPPPARAKR